MSTYREPLFDINSLSPTQDLAATISKTNEIVDSINTLYAADVFEGDGICTTRADGVVTVNVDPGPGIGIALTGEVTLNFNNVNSVNSTQNDDNLFIGRSNVIYKVNAESILPPTVLGNHLFTGSLTFGVNPFMFGFTNSIGSVVAEPSAAGSPRGVSIKTSLDSGLNLSPFALTRNYILGSDENSAIFNYATTSFNSAFQNKIVVSYYTGIENSSQQIKYNDESTLAWPAKWSWEYSETLTELNVASTVDSDGELQKNTAISYNYNSVNALNSLFTINGKIFISNLQGSSQFVSSPDGSANKVVLTTNNGLISKRFTNRIVTTDIEPGGLLVGDLVAVFLETNNNTYYGKAQANEIGNNNVIGIVESYSAGQATIALSGEFELTTASLEPGTTYVLSQTQAGKFESSELYTSGIIKPVFVAVTETSGILLNSTTSSNTIGSVSLDNNDGNTEQVLEIDSPNYPLKFIAGANIGFNLTTNDEIEIRVVDAAGAQDVFTTVLLNNNESITANSPTDTLSIVSNSLNLELDTDGYSVRIETPNLYTSATFYNSSSSSFVLNPSTTDSTLQFNAGSGITFVQNGSTVTINASISGGVNPSNISFGGPFRILVSDASSAGTTVSLYGGGDGDAFDGATSGHQTIDLALNSNLNITYNPLTQQYSYNGQIYTLHETFSDPNYLPDELAGYMFGRVTVGVGGDLQTNPNNKINRLSRQDVRYFLGIDTEGYIPSINRIFNAWRIYDSSGTQQGNSVTAESKEGFINFQEGSGISLVIDETQGGEPTLMISSNTIPQNAFSSYFVNNEEFAASSTSDSIYFESGDNIELIPSTNNTISFNLTTPNAYTLLGNDGNTNNTNEIDFSAEEYCLVGRAGSEIKPLIADDFKWTLVSSVFEEPVYKLPYFGLVSVSTGSSIVHCDASVSGKINLIATGGITLQADGNSNDGYTITIGGQSGTGPSSGLNVIQENGNSYAVGPTFTTLKFMSGAGVGFTSQSGAAGTNSVVITGNFNSVSPHTVLGNNDIKSGVPVAIPLITDSVLGRLKNNIQPITFNDIKNALDIRYYTRVQYTNDGTTNNLLTALNTVTGSNLKFAAGSNINFSGASTDTLTISSVTKLSSDSNPIFPSIVPANTGTIAIQDGTVVKYGTSTQAITGLKFNSHLDLFGVGQGTTTEYALRKEALTAIPSGYVLATVTSDLGRFTNQKYIVNSNYYETVYGANYYLAVQQYSTSGTKSAGNYNIIANNITASSGYVLFDSINLGKVEFTNKKLSSAYTPAGGTTQTSTFVLEAVNSTTPVILKTVTAASNTAIPDAPMNLHTNNAGIKMIVSGNSSAWLNVAGSETNTVISSSGTINYSNNVTFGNSTTVTFTGAQIVGLNVPLSLHANTHKSVFSASTNSGAVGTDPISAWMVGAVNRSQPTLLNKIALVSGDTKYDFNLSSVATDALLYGSGGTFSNASQITSSISDGTRGPMYLVLNTGQEANLSSFAGPPGQIIMIKKA